MQDDIAESTTTRRGTSCRSRGRLAAVTVVLALTGAAGTAVAAPSAGLVTGYTASGAGSAPRDSAPAARPVAPTQHDGLDVRVAAHSAGEAALAYATAHRRGSGELRVVSESTDAVGTVVRLSQSVNGIEVLGGTMIVRLDGTPGAFVVRGATDGTSVLEVTRSGAWSPARLERMVRAQAQQRYRTDQFTATAGKEVVIPIGKGVLTRQVVLTMARTGEVRDLYVSAKTGAVILDIPRRKEADVTSTERNLAGEKVTIHAEKSGGIFRLTDVSRAPAGPVIVGQKDVDFLAEDITTRRLPFGADDTARGSIDAHLAVGKAVDYYRKVLGRNGIDGVGGDIIHVTGANMVNAYWDGTQMVIGIGDEEYKPLSADPDVVAHELTHGVVEHTAGLIYQSQSGALNEAYADYFGNAVDVGQSAAAMKAPRNGLLGEDLCRTLRPVKCAIRNLDDGRTVKDYTGTLADIGGVHLNATIYGGALWDIRQGMDPTLADKVVYRGLSAYMTPWSTFTDARAATLAAADDLRLTAAQKAVVVKAYDSRGIVPGWESDGRTDADRTLASDLPFFSDWFPPVAGGGRWVIADIDVYGNWPTGFRTGRTDGNQDERVSLPDGHSILGMETDGRHVAVNSSNGLENGVWLYDTVSEKGTWLAKGDYNHTYVYPTIAGGRVAWQDSATVNGAPDVSIYVATIGKPGVRRIDRPGDVLVHFPSLSETTLAYVQGPMGVKDLVVRDAKTLAPVATKRIVKNDVDTTFIPTALRDAVVWTYVDWHREYPLGARVSAYVSPRDLSSSRLLNELPLPSLWSSDLIAQATDRAFTHIRPKSIVTAHPEVIQKPLAGGPAVPVTCDKGGAYLFDADEGRAVVWFSGAQGKVDLVVRDKPAGPC